MQMEFQHDDRDLKETKYHEQKYRGCRFKTNLLKCVDVGKSASSS